MKKILLALVLATLMSAGAFAQRPDGWGIGIMGQYGLDWYHANHGTAVFSLKAPQLPIYWGIRISAHGDWFHIGVSGDYYLLEQPLVDDINFGWYFGLGGYVGLGSHGVQLGGRLPVGIYILPLEEIPLEIFLEIVPTINILFHENGVRFPTGGAHFGLGIRFWF